MGLVLKEEATYQTAPAGQFVAVCVDVVDVGMVETTWQGQKSVKHKCRLVFELNEEREDGARFRVSRQFTASLNEKANLRKFLESWRGRPFTKEELAGFDTEVLIGINAVVQIIHNERGYADIDAIMKPMKGLPLIKPSGDYVRVKDRPEGQHEDGPPHDDAPPHDDEDGDGLPF